jgi:hypothetical protein
MFGRFSESKRPAGDTHHGTVNSFATKPCHVILPPMKHLLPPAFAVLVSTAGTVWGCHAAGMTTTEITIAGALAFTLSFGAAFVAVLLASRPRGLPRDPAA